MLGAKKWEVVTSSMWEAPTDEGDGHGGVVMLKRSLEK
jgi:hypothetical protein